MLRSLLPEAIPALPTRGRPHLTRRCDPLSTRRQQLSFWHIEDNGVRVVELDAGDYRAVLDSMATAGLSGGVIHDALAVHAARKVGAKRIMTLNESDFARLCPENHPVFTAPPTVATLA